MFRSLTHPFTWLPGLGAAVLAASLSTPAHADPGAHRGRLERFCAQAKCTDAQEKALREAFREFRRDTEADREEIQKLRKAVAAEFVKAKPDEKQLQGLTQRIHRVHGQIGDRRLDLMLEIHGLLKPDQRKRLAELLNKRRGGGRGGPQPGPSPSK